MQKVSIVQEVKKSYLDYAMSVISSRALPDVRDGLKPVHRRILYAMHESGYTHSKPYHKSARIVGDVMGKYHPHGDAAIYQTMVRMAQDFSMLVMLIDGQGNFGSIDGDSPAAMRYTEARLAKISSTMLEDINNDTVSFIPNYDESLFEPTVLPSKFPNLLVNGSSGIAVGMATNIAPHNLAEVIDGTIAILKNPNISIEELINIIPGPDFPTGGTIIGRRGIFEGYLTGRGTITIRSKYHEETRGDRTSLIITEIPYQENKSLIMEHIADQIKEKNIDGVSELRDESNREGIRIVFDLKRDANVSVLLHQLWKYSNLQNSFSMNTLSINNGRPEILNIKQMIDAFIVFRKEVVIKRTKFKRKKALEKAHGVIGLIVAVSAIDNIIPMIKESKNTESARLSIMSIKWQDNKILDKIKVIENASDSYYLSESQAQGILDLKLSKLTQLEEEKLNNELLSLKDTIDKCDALLANESILEETIITEMLEIKTLYGKPRKTKIDFAENDDNFENLIPNEDMVVSLTVGGYIKRVPLCDYKAQRRGGKGRSGISMRDADTVSSMFSTDTHTNVLFFTKLGRVFSSKVYKLPLSNLQGRGKPIIHVFPLEQEDKITNMMPMPSPDMCEEKFMVFSTSTGNIRKNSISDFMNIRSNGKKAIILEEGEFLVDVAICNTGDDIFLTTKNGQAIRFCEDDLRVIKSRDSNGVRGMRVSKDDIVISMSILDKASFTIEERDEYLKREKNEVETDNARYLEMQENEQFVISITDSGYGKRTSAYSYKQTRRGGSGITNMLLTEKNGSLIASFPIDSADDIVLITDQGTLLRCNAKDVRLCGRTTQGVILMRLSDEKIVSAIKIKRYDSQDDTEDDIENDLETISGDSSESNYEEEGDKEVA
jgi:DNA gyrase subunit A